ncbi:MAG TPA: hypothetical protein VHX88_18360 [Solirubrobacteraceae bacterium]|nr:hypothetical protein [Solirubrobacteraceae bacterium]
MRSIATEASLREYVGQAAARLSEALAGGEEVTFELEAQATRSRRAALYDYRPLTAEFIRAHEAQLRELPAHQQASELIESVAGCERYLIARGAAAVPVDPIDRANAVLRTLLEDVFAGCSDFAVREERVVEALAALDDAVVGAGQHTIVLAAIGGLAIASDEVPLASGLALVRPGALDGPPDEMMGGPGGRPTLVAQVTLEDVDPAALEEATALLRELLRALRLFGDGRIVLEPIAWTRVGAAPWRAFALPGGARARGMLVVPADQEDELRAFCSLVARRSGRHPELSYAMERFEFGCERGNDLQSLSDYLLGLRALLEPELEGRGGRLASRVAALCATAERRGALAEQLIAALELERMAMQGRLTKPLAGQDTLVRALGEHLRALLRDVVCGHLDPDLPALADELLAPPEPEKPEEPIEVEAGFDLEDEADPDAETVARVERAPFAGVWGDGGEGSARLF